MAIVNGDRELRLETRTLGKEFHDFQKQYELDMNAIREEQKFAGEKVAGLTSAVERLIAEIRNPQKGVPEEQSDQEPAFRPQEAMARHQEPNREQPTQCPPQTHNFQALPHMNPPWQQPYPPYPPAMPQEQQFQSQGQQFRYFDNQFANLAGNMPGQLRYPRVECPVYDGCGSFRNWLCKFEQFCVFNQVPEFHKIGTAYFQLNGEALEWHHSFLEDKKGYPVSWEMYRYNMGLRFDRNQLRDPMIDLKKVVQVGSVDEYQAEFERIRAQTSCSEAMALSMFLGGLKEKILRLVGTNKPTTVLEAYSYAKLHEEALDTDYTPSIHQYNQPYTQMANRNQSWQFQYNPQSPQFLPAPKSVPPAIKYPPNTNPPQRKPLPPVNNSQKPRKPPISSAEYKERRMKNLCFWCDEKFSPTHKCNGRRLYSLEICPEEEEEKDEFQEALEELSQEEMCVPEGSQNICMYALNGMPVYNTLKLQGMIEGKTVVILLDSGSTHNVLSAELAMKLHCEMEEVPSYKVSLANGRQVKGSTQCKNLEWSVGGEVFVIDALILPLNDYDLILGMQWLEPLGQMTWNFQSRTLKFQHEGKEVELQALPKPAVSWMTAEQLLATVSKEEGKGENQYYLVQLLTQSLTIEQQQSISAKMKEQLEGLLQQYNEVFKEPKTLPPKRVQDHRIHLKNSEPISVKPYRYPTIQKDAMEQLVQEMLEAGVIRDSNSPFSSPVVLVKKKDGSWRMCIDYRELNRATVKDKFPMPVIEELLDELHGAKFFSKIDLRSGYHQIRMHEPDIQKTAFRTHMGHYEFLVMPFGLTNAPSTFQSTMNSLLKPLLRKCALVFFDDILIYSRTWEDHLRHIEAVLALLLQNQFFAKAEKCQFGEQQIEYLGHIISAKGVATDMVKVEAMSQWPVPRNVKELRGFLGLTGYYRRFIRNYGLIAKPLTRLLQKGAFEWSQTAEHAFRELKKAMVTAPVLSLPDFSEEFVIETDASGAGIGAVLMQRHHPIAFLSKALAPKHQGLSTYEKELLALVMAVTKWRSYLLGRHFVIRTDHHSLKYLVEQRLVTPVQQKWLTKLLGFDYEIRYKKGAENVAADALSRVTSAQVAIAAVTFVNTELMDEIVTSWSNDEKVQEIIRKCEAGTSSAKFTYVDTQLRRKGKLVVGGDAELRHKLIQLIHNSAEGGHSGVTVTTQKLCSLFYWKGLKRNVREFIRKCDTCQRNKSETVASPGLLQPLPIPNRIWEEISMDFIDGLPPSRGNTVIWVVVDRLSKFAHFVALSHPYNASKIAQLYMQHIYKVHGFPRAIISDRDPTFTSNFWRELFHRSKVQLNFSTAYHPQSDGQTEVVNRCIETYLRCMTGEKPKAWSDWLPLAQWWYNTNYHSSLQASPYEVMYGQSPPIHIPYIPGDSTNAAVDRSLSAREEMLKAVKANLLKAQNRMKQLADKHRSERELAVGDWVYLKLQPYRQHSLLKRISHKISPKYCGPFQIIERIGPVAYRLQLPASAKIHDVVHVVLLKRKIADTATNSVVPDLPSFMLQGGEPEAVPFKVLDRKGKRKGRVAKTMWLVQWKDRNEDDATWEDAQDIRKRFPTFDPDS